MLVETIHISNFTDLHDALSHFGGNDMWAYRGQSNPAWPLLPKAGRAPYNQEPDELYLLEWKEGAAEFLGKEPKNAWEWLAIAQHYGLATRLLDWTRNPLVAAFFAIWEQPATDAILFAHFANDVSTFDSTSAVSLDDIVSADDGVVRIVADAFVPRIGRQQGVFTIHSPPSVALQDDSGYEEDQLIRLVLAHKYHHMLGIELSRYGINRATLFPDLDGLAAHINWKLAGPTSRRYQETWTREQIDAWTALRKRPTPPPPDADETVIDRSPNPSLQRTLPGLSPGQRR